ncbi:MAG TPA: hypothetical protein VF785_09585 [Gemmatimonadaceae bacterium]
MPTRSSRVPCNPSYWLRTALVGLVLPVLSPLVATAGGQLIQIKTLPIADGDQWRIFPSANGGMAGVSIAVTDSLLDPFVNPAKASRITPGRSGMFFGSPTFFSVSENAGGGRTIPLGGIVRAGATFAAFDVALQEIDAINPSSQQIFPPGVFVTNGLATQMTQATQTTPSRQNKYAFGSLGHAFSSGISVAGSAQWSGLHDVDGVDLLYAGSTGIVQHGDALDARFGVTKEWSRGPGSGTQTLEAILLHDRFSMTHDVTWADQVWDPNTRIFTTRPRVDHNLDRTDTWGLHLAYSRPVGDSGWRVGGIVTGNLASHPKLPDYQISQVMVIPWDPGHSAAYDLGLGVSKATGPTTFGLDAIYEPIATHTWGEANGPIQTQTGTIPDGGKTTENHFHFSNAILRTGVAHDLALGSDQKLRLELGVGLRSIDYTLDQVDHVTGVARTQDESWIEWTKTWGLSLHFSDLEMRYTGRMTTGTGRPGIVPNDVRVFAAAETSGPNVIAAPNGALTLTGVAVTTHQISISLPIR